MLLQLMYIEGNLHSKLQLTYYWIPNFMFMLYDYRIFERHRKFIGYWRLFLLINKPIHFFNPQNSKSTTTAWCQSKRNQKETSGNRKSEVKKKKTKWIFSEPRKDKGEVKRTWQKNQLFLYKSRTFQRYIPDCLGRTELIRVACKVKTDAADGDVLTVDDDNTAFLQIEFFPLLS